MSHLLTTGVDADKLDRKLGDVMVLAVCLQFAVTIRVSEGGDAIPRTKLGDLSLGFGSCIDTGDIRQRWLTETALVLPGEDSLRACGD